MKLVEIKDVRTGQVWENIKMGEFHTVDSLNQFRSVERERIIRIRNDYLKECKLVGKLGITHKIEGNKLIEIPRKYIYEIDDIVHYWEGHIGENKNQVAIVANTHDACRSKPTLFNGWKFFEAVKCQVVGIYGVTHEFINDCEVSND